MKTILSLFIFVAVATLIVIIVQSLGGTDLSAGMLGATLATLLDRELFDN